jgi:centromeric protein E
LVLKFSGVSSSKFLNKYQSIFFLQGEKAEAHKEIKKLQNQRTLLERDLRKQDSITVDKRHELNVKPEELAGFFDQAAQMQVAVLPTCITTWFVQIHYS